MSLEDRILDGGANHSKSSAMWSTEGEKEIISRKIEDLSLSSALQAESDSLSYSNSRFEKGEAKGALYQPLRSRPLLFDPLAERHSGPLSGPRGVMAEARFDEFNKQKEADRQRYFARPGNNYYTKASLLTSIEMEGNQSYSLAEEIKIKKLNRPPRDGDKDIDDIDDEDDIMRKHPIHKHDSLYYHPSIDDSDSDNDDKFRQHQAAKDQNDYGKSGVDNDYGDDDDDDDDKEDYKRRRFTSFFGSSSSSSSSSSSYSSSSTPSRYRSTSRVERLQYGLRILSSSSSLPLFVDECKKPSYCLCLIWDDYAKVECVPWIRAWKKLSDDFPCTSFLMLKASDASNHWDPISIPALAVYYGGETVSAFVRLHGPEDEGGSGLGKQPTTAHIHAWLSKYKWLS
jgi:hypothetical protein